ncbi:MAG TPA: site-specific integrase [Candidatus Acidoferrales bacterium]|jgi:integrase|nr:site-specific integrase [Candidatus Acidoferrales bacterium]
MRTRIQQGYIFSRCGYWYVRYYDNVIQEGTSQRRQQCERLAPKNEEYPTKRSVKALASKFLNPINAGEVDPQSTMKLTDFINKVYLPDVKESKRRSTYKNYSDIARLHVVPRLDNMTLRKFRCCDAERILKAIAKDAKTPKGEPLSHSTLERVKAFLSATFKTAKRLGAFDGANPVKDSKTPEGQPSKPTYAYSEIEFRAILGCFGEDEVARTVIMLAGHSGLRKGEIEGLLWKDYDGLTLNIQRSLWNGFTQKPKTDASAAPIPVNRQLRRALEDHRTRMGDWARDGFPIFQSEVHSPLNVANLVKRVISPRLEQCTVCAKPESEHTPAGDHAYQRNKTLPRWEGWHAFRRGLATNLHAAGTDDKTIQAVLRHSNVRVTQDSYIKTIPTTTIAAMEKIGEQMESKSVVCTVHAPESAPAAANLPN